MPLSADNISASHNWEILIRVAGFGRVALRRTTAGENVCHFMLLSPGLFLAQKKEVGVTPGARIDNGGKVSGEIVGITLISQWKGKGNFQRDLGRPDEFTVSPR